MGEIVELRCRCGYRRELYEGSGFLMRCHAAVACPQGHWLYRLDTDYEAMPADCPTCGDHLGELWPDGWDSIMPPLICPKCGERTLEPKHIGTWD